MLIRTLMDRCRWQSAWLVVVMHLAVAGASLDQRFFLLCLRRLLLLTGSNPLFKTSKMAQ